MTAIKGADDVSLYEQLKDKVNFRFDLEEIRAKYKEERDRRIRKHYDQQFVHVDFEEHPEHLVTDPNMPVTPRDAVDEDVEVQIKSRRLPLHPRRVLEQDSTHTSPDFVSDSSTVEQHPC